MHVSARATVHDDKRHLALAQAYLDFLPAIETRVVNSEQVSRANVAVNANPASNSRSKHQNPLKRPRTASTVYPNPPYRNPFHRPQPRHTANVSTPSARPRTAPESSDSTIQVPRTVHEIRRAVSEPPQSLTPIVSNSQECDDAEQGSDDRISSPLGAKSGIIVGLSQASLDHEPPPKRARGHQSSSPLHFAASIPVTPSDVSTATPSQPIEAINRAWPMQSPINPSGSNSIMSISSGSPQREFEVRMAPASDEKDGGVVPCAAIDALPLEVTAPQPAVGHGTFSSHVTKRLQYIMERLPLHLIFMPLRVTRDVKVLERGHWLMEITIAPDNVVKQARSSPAQKVAMQDLTDRFAAPTAQNRTDRFWHTKKTGKMQAYDYGHEDEAVGKWTEAEFLAFWDTFSTFIEKGNAGWAIRMVRDELSLPHPSDGLRKLRVRIFTWGEVIAHVYLAIWLFSEKTSVRIPMKWVAGDGMVVIEMSGKKKYTGSLRPWVRKGPSGEKGSWGIADGD